MTEQRSEYDATDRKRFEELVLNAVGFNAAKDIVAKREPTADVAARFTSAVQSMPFFREPVPLALASASPLPGGMQDWIGYGLAGVVALALMLIARGQLKRSHAAFLAAEQRAREAADAETAKRTPAAAAEEAGSEEDEIQKSIRQRRNDLRDSVKKKIMEDPAGAAGIIRTWIQEG